MIEEARESARKEGGKDGGKEGREVMARRLIFNLLLTI